MKHQFIQQEAQLLTNTPVKTNQQNLQKKLTQESLSFLGTFNTFFSSQFPALPHTVQKKQKTLERLRLKSYSHREVRLYTLHPNKNKSIGVSKRKGIILHQKIIS